MVLPSIISLELLIAPIHNSRGIVDGPFIYNIHPMYNNPYGLQMALPSIISLELLIAPIHNSRDIVDGPFIYNIHPMYNNP
jgi:hypothetical protein